MAAKQRFVIMLEDADSPGGVPVYQRLKQFMKQALRRWGLKCVYVKEVDGGQLRERPNEASSDNPEI